MTDLAGLDEFGDGAGGVLDRHLGVESVLIEQVDVVGAQPLQRSVDNLADVVGLRVQPLETVVDVEAELGGDPHLVTDRFENRPDEQLILMGAVDLGGVEERDADVESRGDGVFRLVCGGEAHAAEADVGDLEAG